MNEKAMTAPPPVLLEARALLVPNLPLGARPSPQACSARRIDQLGHRAPAPVGCQSEAAWGEHRERLWRTRS